MKFAGVHVACAPAIPTTKLRRTSRPRGRVDDLGVELDPVQVPAPASTRPANGVEPVWAVEWKPSGRRVIESPWLIQTGCSRSMPAKSGSSAVIVTVAGPYSRFEAGRTSPPSSRAMSWAP